MAHSNISIFVPHAGCPHMCSFCNQRTISGQQTAPTAKDVRRICSQAMNEVKDKKSCEIAFFGGSFTAIDRGYMTELLSAANEFLGEDGFHGIRISTRPDFIDDEVLGILKKYGVTAIELGAQSMKNHVLKANDRGHTVEDVYKACELIRRCGFELGLQMMVGLYHSRYKDELDTADRIINIHPDTVRIYPVVVLKGTRLAELYESGEYKLDSFEHIVELCAFMLEKFADKNIEVIRCGLHASDEVSGDMVAGFYHPAFKELCESYIYRQKMEVQIINSVRGCGIVRLAAWRLKKTICAFEVNPSCISKALGHKKSNVSYFKEMGVDIKVCGDESVPKYQCKLKA